MFNIYKISQCKHIFEVTITVRFNNHDILSFEHHNYPNALYIPTSTTHNRSVMLKQFEME